MKEVILVMVGGGLGAVLRHLITKIPFKSEFLYNPTLIANGLACLLLGFLVVYTKKQSVSHQTLTLALGTGFCGGLSTFSTFIKEIYQVSDNSQWAAGLTIIGLSLFVGLLTFAIGMYLAKWVLN